MAGKWKQFASVSETIFALITIAYIFYSPTNSEAVRFNKNNIDNILATHELVIINFYADWCKYSNMLMPIFDEAAKNLTNHITESGKVVLGKVDCEQESELASRYRITKYPTVKVIRNGLPAKKEYRGERTAKGFVEFTIKELEDPVKEVAHLKELVSIPLDKRIIVGYFDHRHQNEYNFFRRVAMNLKDDCHFRVLLGEAAQQMHPPGKPIVVFQPDKSRTNDMEETFTGNMLNFDELHIWSQEKCVPTVREITFENAEEFTEEGLPFLILFHHPDDSESIKKYNRIVLDELLTERQSINFLTADGKKFAHPLHHLGKSEGDLPLIAIDSFRHMYLFPDFKDMETPGKLKSFIQDLYSGKLHREFHYGPDVDEPKQITMQIDKKVTTPPESTFKKLAPSKNRYTLLKDEL